MADLISQKLISSQNVSPQWAYTPSVEKKSAENTEKAFSDRLRENKTNIIAGGLITGGTVLLYLGLTRPGKNKIFDKYISGRMEKMDSIVKSFSDFVSEKIESSSNELFSYIAKYRKTHIANSEEYIPKLKAADEPKKVLTEQDNAFGVLYQNFKEGIKNYKDDFSVLFMKIKYGVKGEISGKQNRTILALKDYLTLPRGDFDEELLKGVEMHLAGKQKKLLAYMERLKNTEINKIENLRFQQMADAITESRFSVTRTKEAILDTAFDKVVKMLNLGKDFEPKYRLRRYDLGGIKSINKYLKPISIPDKVMENFEPNLFMEILTKTDLDKLSEDDIRAIFFRMPFDYNLKDLRYLIDRIRLHRALAAAEKPYGQSAKVYKTMEVKLEYLSNILNDYGEKELLKYCDFDIEKLNPDQIEGKMAYINKVSRRLGYENFSVMNREMLKTNEKYAKLQLPNYAEMIEGNPKKFFVG